MSQRKVGRVPPKLALVSLLAATAVAGCADAPDQRDVYSGATLEDARKACADDWGSEDLCEPADTHATETYTSNGYGAHGGGPVYFFHGPCYPYGYREVTRSGVTYRPQTGYEGSSARVPVATSAFRNGTFTGRTGGFSGSSFGSGVGISRGGFGATGAHFGGFGGS